MEIQLVEDHPRPGGVEHVIPGRQAVQAVSAVQAGEGGMPGGIGDGCPGERDGPIRGHLAGDGIDLVDALPGSPRAAAGGEEEQD